MLIIFWEYAKVESNSTRVERTIMEKMKFYSGKNIRAKNALYNVIFGERSNGKTFDVLREAFREYIDSGEQNQLALVRRWAEDFVGPNSARTSYDALMHDGNGKNQIKP